MTESFNEVTDFSASEPQFFTADGEKFELVAELAGMAHLKITDQFSSLAEVIKSDPAKAIDAITTMINVILVPQSAARFVDRMNGGDKPIGLTRAVKVIKWGIEQITGRPTQPDELSPSG